MSVGRIARPCAQGRDSPGDRARLNGRDPRRRGHGRRGRASRARRCTASSSRRAVRGSVRASPARANRPAAARGSVGDELGLPPVDERDVGLPLDHPGFERPEFAGLDVRRVRDDDVPAPPGRPANRSCRRSSTRDPVSVGILAGEGESLVGHVDPRDLGAGVLVGDRQRDRARAPSPRPARAATRRRPAGPGSTRRPPRSPVRGMSALGSTASTSRRNPHSPSTYCSGSPWPRGARRARPHPSELAGVERSVELQVELAPGQPEDVPEKQLGVDPPVFHPARFEPRSRAAQHVPAEGGPGSVSGRDRPAVTPRPRGRDGAPRPGATR